MPWHAHVDIAIVNYHSADDIRGCLKSLGPWTQGRIWLVNNDSDTAQAAMLARLETEHPQVTLLTPGENLGFGRGCNVAFERSSAEFLLLLNPDARISQTDIGLMLKALQRDPNLGGVSPATFWNEEKSFVLPPPSLQSPGSHLAQVAASWWPAATRVLAQRLVRRTQRQMAQKAPFPAQFLAGAVLLLRRRAVEAAGGLFDPAFFMFFEDADLSVRLRRSGYTLALLPQAQAVHNYRHKAFKAELMAQSQLQFFDLRYRWYLRPSGRLRGVERLARPLQPPVWFEMLGTLDSAQAFAVATMGARVEAFSPSPLMRPAIARPIGHAGCGFTPQEWALLEPGTYVAWLRGDTAPRRWVHFVRD